MESACWHCGDPSHHARACDKPPDAKVKRKIQAVRKKVDHGKHQEINKKKLEANQKKLEMAKELPPEAEFKKEVLRLLDFARNISEKADELPSGNPTDVGILTQRLAQGESLKQEFSKELETIRIARSVMKNYAKAYELTDKMKVIKDEVAFIGEFQKSMNNSLYRYVSEKKSSLKAVQEFGKSKEVLETYVSDMNNAISSGRQWIIAECNKKWGEHENVLKNLEELAKKYSYLFDDTDNLILPFNDLKSAWEDLSSRRQNQFEQGVSTLCKICYVEDIQVALQCGHVFCKGCVEKFTNKQCAYCRARFSISDILVLLFL